MHFFAAHLFIDHEDVPFLNSGLPDGNPISGVVDNRDFWSNLSRPRDWI
jgi:hypothetical protein